MRTFKHLKYEVAIPDSYLYGIKTDIDRTMKVFQLSRTLSLFRINNLYIYHDKILNPGSYERQFLTTILEYLDTPQYLRRKIYPMSQMLKSVGRLHPIRSPHHKDKVEVKYLKSGEIRVGLLEKKGGILYVDVGLDSLINYNGKFHQVGKKINVKILMNSKQIHAVDVADDELSHMFWGYKVNYISDLKRIIEKFNPSNLLLTLKDSKYFDREAMYSKMTKGYEPDSTILVVFGSPKYGLDIIFDKEGIDMKKYLSYNFFPHQGTQTVRLEEAILGVLSILNSCLK
ncbi:MAG TPA: putative RNA uridine N3 methyltransferase [Candidatus Nitrosocosmicus sp.]|nr:putative RNA uridine N3 methyltransferase [Candidatus Nitrosocosmicus sp.]